MAVNHVDRIQRVQVPSSLPAAEQPRQRERLDLDQGEGFDSGTSTDLGGYTPAADPQVQARLGVLYAGLSDDQAAKLRSSSASLGKALITAGASASTSSEVQDTGASTLALWLAGAGSDANAATGDEFMSLAIGGMESYLADFAKNLKDGINLGKELRTYQTELQDMLSSWPAGKTQSFTWKEVVFDSKGGYTVVEKSADLTKDQAKQLLDKLGEQGKSLSDTNDLAKYDLQQKYQDYTQAVQTLAGIQSQVYLDAMKVIGNLKA
jgi:hypothetical protein